MVLFKTDVTGQKTSSNHAHPTRQVQTGHKTYEQILLRESYRQPGGKRSAVRKRTLLNLTKYSQQIVVRHG
jgi:hypothetical protein